MDIYKLLLDHIDCPVCKQPLSEPTAIPCGHCYCGLQSGRTCLQATQRGNQHVEGEGEQSTGQCSVCKQTFNQDIEQLQPLFGIRDFLNIFSSVAQKIPSCADHVQSPFVFWCCTCEKRLCYFCFEQSHERHVLTSFCTYLHERVTQFMTVHGSLFTDSSPAILNESIREIGAQKIESEQTFEEFMPGIREFEEFRNDKNGPRDLKVVESVLQDLQSHLSKSSSLRETVFQFNLVLFRNKILKCTETIRPVNDEHNTFSIKISKNTSNLTNSNYDLWSSLVGTFEWRYDGDIELNAVTFSGSVEVLTTQEGIKPFRKSFSASCVGKKELSTHTELLQLCPSTIPDWLHSFYRKKTLSILIGGEREPITCFTLILKCLFRLSVQH